MKAPGVRELATTTSRRTSDRPVVWSISQLRRMIRQGKLQNVADDGEVRVLRSALPRKPGQAKTAFAFGDDEPLTWRTQVARAVASGE